MGHSNGRAYCLQLERATRTKATLIMYCPAENPSMLFKIPSGMVPRNPASLLFHLLPGSCILSCSHKELFLRLFPFYLGNSCLSAMTQLDALLSEKASLLAYGKSGTKENSGMACSLFFFKLNTSPPFLPVCENIFLIKSALKMADIALHPHPLPHFL